MRRKPFSGAIAAIVAALCLTCGVAAQQKPGKATKMETGQIGLMLTLDKVVYTEKDSVMHAALTVVNQTKKPLTWLEHGQTYTWQIVDASGKTVWDYARGRRFPKFVRQRTLARGTQAYSCAVPLQTQDGTPLPAGRYTLRGRLVGFDGAAELGFSVTNGVVDSPRGAGLQ